MARASRWLLSGVVAGAAAIRLVGIGFGLPFPYAVLDERIVTDRVAGFLRGDLNPHYFAYPSLCFELHGVVGFGRFVVGWIAGEWSSLAQFRERCWLEPGILLLPSRWLTALLGIATVWAVARAAAELGRAIAPGSRNLRRTAAIAGAVALATCLLHVGNSRTITVDIPCVLFGALALAHSLRHARTLRRRDLLLAALYAGLAGSSKYYGALFALPVAAAAVVAAWRRAKEAPATGMAQGSALRGGAAALVLAGATTLATFLVTSPFIVLDWPAFARDFSFLEQHVEGGHYGHDAAANGALVYGRLLWSEEVGPAVLLTAALGLLLLILRISRGGAGASGATLVVLLQPVAHFALIATFKAHPPDYLLPLVPALAAATGVAIAWIASLPGRFGDPSRAPRAGARLAEAVVAGVVVLPLLHDGWRGLQKGLELRRPDSRVLLRDWAASHWPDATKVASDSWLELPLTPACVEQIAADRASGALVPSRRGPDWPDEQLAAVLADARRSPPAAGIDFLLLLPRELDLGEELVATLRGNGFRWLVLNGIHATRTRRMGGQFPARAALYERLWNGPWVVARFPDPADAGSGPELVVCDLDLVERR